MLCKCKHGIIQGRYEGGAVTSSWVRLHGKQSICAGLWSMSKTLTEIEGRERCSRLITGFSVSGGMRGHRSFWRLKGNSKGFWETGGPEGAKSRGRLEQSFGDDLQVSLELAPQLCNPGDASRRSERRKVSPKWARNRVDGKECSKFKIPDSGGEFQTPAAACHTQSVLDHKLPFWSVLSKWRLTVWILTPQSDVASPRCPQSLSPAAQTSLSWLSKGSLCLETGCFLLSVPSTGSDSFGSPWYVSSFRSGVASWSKTDSVAQGYRVCPYPVDGDCVVLAWPIPELEF